MGFPILQVQIQRQCHDEIGRLLEEKAPGGVGGTENHGCSENGGNNLTPKSSG